MKQRILKAQAIQEKLSNIGKDKQVFKATKNKSTNLRLLIINERNPARL